MLSAGIKVVQEAATADVGGIANAEILNISSTGACIQYGDPLAVGSIIVLRIPSSNDIIPIPARVVWTKSDGCHGVEFSFGDDDETRYRINALIHDTAENE